MRAAAASALRLLALAALVAVAQPITAQEQPPPARLAPPDERVVRGRVVRPDRAGDLRPVRDAWVVLHRVGSDTAAPLDSMRSRADGSFAFRYRAFGSPDALYFVSASHAGIAYFGPPLREQDARGEGAEVLVYDTTSAGVALNVRGRHLVLGAPRPDGTRDVVEVFEIANDSSVTRVAAGDTVPTWTTALPAQAIDFQVGQGDIAPQTIRAALGRVDVSAPFAPGLKQLSFAYRLPRSSFPVTFTMSGGATVLEVLLEEPTATANGAGVRRVEPVDVEGRRFSRFLAQDVAPGARVEVAAPLVASSEERRLWMRLVGGGIALAMLLALVLVAARRRRAAREIAPLESSESPAVLARTIAALDEAFERAPAADAGARDFYERERAALKTRLARALAAGERPT